MKKTFYSAITTALACLLFVTSCDKSISVTEQLTPLKPASVDEDAGNWTMVHMTSNTQVAVPAPAEVTSDAYKAELASLKDIQSKLNANQKKSIEYWAGGGVLRWNQIFRELVARYNLPPAPTAEGTYPAPDAENPFNDPQFPFSNPPYAARSYAYVSTAVYDALKAAWYYKYLYKRPAPYVTDPGVTALVPQSDLPSYPSEDAVMSGAAAEMLKVLFPAALEEITLKAGEQRNAALWSGKATSSDIAAGLALGKSVADLFKARAANDGMRNAIGNKQLWEDLKKNATSRGDVAWASLETPPRPPMLPFFYKVTPFKMTYDDIVAMRPGPPPLTGSGEMNDEVKEVKWYVDNLTRERLAIVHKWADGVGTYTPPGHWNDIAAEHIRDANFSEVRAARAFALLNMGQHNAALACWDTKYFYFNPRPTQLDAAIKTGTGVPNFPSYVSGHSTFSAAAASVLSYLFPEHATEFEADASEAAMSRLYAGIHYRKDCDDGLVLGESVGTFLVNGFAKNDGADD
ncbi:phosphatase PAP2 family protein [Chryseolinea lacunae]|uniref:Phosphatase PAP2 family protein n=1 Tax=Chryseolinea lacunae TaxID=2801331 RepID=A0ABS1KSX4_9BACT|nr:phosphatase PAP2 family protein [Chryseolinea lacunae]MBL0742561.1 phosphatase PAP2 family protein [Chryseolinea lacunae]